MVTAERSHGTFREVFIRALRRIVEMDELVTSRCCNKIPDKSNLKTGYFGSQFKSTVHHGQNLRQLVTLRPQLGSRDWCWCSAHSPHSARTSAYRMLPPTSGWVPTTVNLIWEILHRDVQGFVFLVILDPVRLISSTNHDIGGRSRLASSYGSSCLGYHEASVL